MRVSEPEEKREAEIAVSWLAAGGAAPPGAAAAVLASGLGSITFGAATVLAEASKPVRAALTFSDRVGPLSGETTLAVVAWLASWALLAAVWHGRSPPFPRVFALSLALVVAGLLLTFPPVYWAFGAVMDGDGRVAPQGTSTAR